MRTKKELIYGPVIIVDGPHAGKFGLYDDDELANIKNTAIVYLYRKQKYVLLDPNNIVNIEGDYDFFKNTMWQSLGNQYCKQMAK